MFTESKIHAGESSLSAVTPLIRTNQRYKWHGYDGVRFVHHYVIKEALVTSSSMIRGDGQTDMAFPGFLSISGSLIPRKREARVLPVDNKHLTAKTLSFLPLWMGVCHFGGCTAAFHVARAFHSLGKASRQVFRKKMYHFSGDLLGMQKKRLSLWKQQQHGARNTCQLILANKRDLRMVEVLYLVSTSTSHTSVQSLWCSVLGVTVCKGWSRSQSCSVYGQILPLIHLLSAWRNKWKIIMCR